MGSCDRRVLSIASCCLAGIVLAAGCYGTRGGFHGERGADGQKLKIRAEAYSFNARLKRDGKPTTFKLEIYQTDSLLGLSGRGYLGKGALKGWLTSDSIKVYFPATGELLYESLADMTGSAECQSPLAGLKVLALFHELPDTTLAANGLKVTADRSNAKRPRFRVESVWPGCHWHLDLTYDRQKPGWRIRRFEFDDGTGTVLKGTRVKYRAQANVATKRFLVDPPPGTTRITP